LLPCGRGWRPVAGAEIPEAIQRKRCIDICRRTETERNKFDHERSVCLLPARTAVYCYLDDLGDLWIATSDPALCVDTECRIHAEDVLTFVDRLTELIGIPSVGQPVKASPAPKKKTGAERTRLYRERHKASQPASQSVTCDDELPLDRGVG
jgi:hypothetical protein